MIVTEHFVYIHVSRSGGTFLNKLILGLVPGARMIQYHGHLADLPEQYAHLPVIGFVRNPWDWYVSMFFDYRRKPQFVFRTLSESGTLDFEATVSRFLNLGDGSTLSRRLLGQLVNVAPSVIDANTPPRLRNPGLCSKHFAEYPKDQGYYSWLFQLMFETTRPRKIYIGRFENLRSEALRLLKLTGTPITNIMARYLEDAEALNAGQRPSYFVGGYPPELEALVAEKDKYLIDQYDYEFSEGSKYPKADYFNRLGRADVGDLVNRVNAIPESQWKAEDDEKPNKLNNLNDARHIMFRFVNGFDDVYNFHDSPLWDEWKDVLMPIMEQAAHGLGYKDYRFPRVMFARLPAGGKISGHSDRTASYFIHKIHVPITTNAETKFRVGQQERQLPVGEIVEVNNKRNHAVRNDGESDRIHLIFECYNMDDYGKPG